MDWMARRMKLSEQEHSHEPGPQTQVSCYNAYYYRYDWDQQEQG